MEDRQYASDRPPRGPRYDPRYREHRNSPRKGSDLPRAPARPPAEDFFDESYPAPEERDRFPPSKKWVSQDYRKKQEVEDRRQILRRQSSVVEVPSATPTSVNTSEALFGESATDGSGLHQEERATGQEAPLIRGLLTDESGQKNIPVEIPKQPDKNMRDGAVLRDESAMDIDSPVVESSKPPATKATEPHDEASNTKLNLNTAVPQRKGGDLRGEIYHIISLHIHLTSPPLFSIFLFFLFLSSP